MIDLHSHILPGLDDGPSDLATALGMAIAAVDEGVDTVVATPHVNRHYPTTPAQVASAVGRLNVAIARMQLPLAVLPGAELALDSIGQIEDAVLRRLTLGGGTCLLVEAPYSDSGPFLEKQLFDLQVRGFRPLVAHPERALAFKERPQRLAAMVERGVLACVNAGSLAGRHGPTAQELAIRFISEGNVHVVASDAHDDRKRPLQLRAGFEQAERRLPGILAQMSFYTEAAPAAILASAPLPDAPKPPAEERSGWRKLFGRSR